MHPCRREHPAKDDIDKHQHAHADHCWHEIHADEHFDDPARTDHLRDHVKSGHRERGERRHRADGLWFQPIREQIRHRVFARIAQRLGDDEQHGEIGYEESHRIHEAVVALEANDAADAQKARSAHVVTSDCEAVLPALDAAACGKICRASGGFARTEICDDQRDAYEGEEHSECWCEFESVGGGRGRGRSLGEEGEHFLVAEFCQQSGIHFIPATCDADVEPADHPCHQEL